MFDQSVNRGGTFGNVFATGEGDLIGPVRDIEHDAQHV